MAFLKTLEVMILHFNQASTFYNEIFGPELSLRNALFLTSLRSTLFLASHPGGDRGFGWAGTFGRDVPQVRARRPRDLPQGSPC
jgi:hypothetical protein